MTPQRSDQEVKADYEQAMGSELGAPFHKFYNECASLNWEWHEYVALFGTDSGRVDILNEAAGAFFRMVQDILWEAVLLHITRLTDRCGSQGRSNLTMQRLPELVDDEIRKKTEELLAACLAKSKFARGWRNKHIAHRDYDRAMAQENAEALPFASRDMVRAAIDSIATLLNFVQAHYGGSEVGYKLTKSPRNAEVLLLVLREGLKSMAARRERLRSGKPEPGDMGPYSPI